MNSITKTVGKQMVQSTISGVKDQMGRGQSSGPYNIRWDDFNYPPLLKLIHYDPKELPEPLQTIVRRLNWFYILTIVVNVINFINSIAQTIGGEKGIRIFFSILNIIIFIPASLFTFYKGYRGLASTQRDLKIYYASQAILIVCYFIFMIIGGGSFNGWVRVGTLFDLGLPFQAVLGIFESLIYLFLVLLGIYSMIKVRKFADDPVLSRA